jgi:hypothetical protein
MTASGLPPSGDVAAVVDCIALLPQWWHAPGEMSPVLRVAPVLLAAGTAVSARSLADACFATRLLDANNADATNTQSTLTRWMLTVVPDAVTSVRLSGDRTVGSPFNRPVTETPMFVNGRSGAMRDAVQTNGAPPFLSLPLRSLTLAGVLLRMQSAALRKISYTGTHWNAWSVLSAVCARVGPQSLRSLQVAGHKGRVDDVEASRRHFLTALTHCRGLTSLGVAHVFAASEYLVPANAPPAESYPSVAAAAGTFLSTTTSMVDLAAAAMSALGPTLRALDCHLDYPDDVEALIALPSALPRLSNLTVNTVSTAVLGSNSVAARAIGAFLPMLESLNLKDALRDAAAVYAADLTLADAQVPIARLRLQTLRAGASNPAAREAAGEGFVPLLELLQPSVAPALAEVDLAGDGACVIHATPALAAALARLSNCTSLSVGVHWLDDAQLHQLLNAMPQLQRLTLVDHERFGPQLYPTWAARQLVVGGERHARTSSECSVQRLKYPALCRQVRRLSGIGGSAWQQCVFPRAKLDPQYYADVLH